MLLPKRCRTFKVKGEREKKSNSVEEIAQFAEEYSFFSPVHPLIGTVTEQEQDIWLVCDLLKTIYDKVSLEQRELMTLEVVTKILAYRNLKEGMEILIPAHGRLIRYRVDRVLELSKNFPAFGLIPERDAVPALLLFRGTDISWRGRYSMASDFGLKGVGYRLFSNAHAKISAWLQQTGTTQALGYSLGGILAGYALLYGPELIETAFAFDPPGFSPKLYKEWEKRGLSSRLKVYVTRGDFCALVGRIVGDACELSTGRNLRPITAHTMIITAQPTYFITPIQKR